MTTADILEHIANILQDADNVRWSSPELIAYADESQRDFATRTGLSRTAATLGAHATLTSPTYAYYALPTDLLSLDRLELSTGAAIDPIDPSAFPWGYEWQSVSGEPIGYLHGPYGPGAIRLYPYPTSAQALTAYYTQQPASLATDEPTIPAAWHWAIVYGAVFRAYVKDFDAKDPAKAATFQAQYEALIQQAQGFAPSAPRSVPYRHL